MPKANHRFFTLRTMVHDTTIRVALREPLDADRITEWISMVATAENVADDYCLSRSDQDAFALAYAQHRREAAIG